MHSTPHKKNKKNNMHSSTEDNTHSTQIITIQALQKRKYTRKFHLIETLTCVRRHHNSSDQKLRYSALLRTKYTYACALYHIFCMYLHSTKDKRGVQLHIKDNQEITSHTEFQKHMP